MGFNIDTDWNKQYWPTFDTEVIKFFEILMAHTYSRWKRNRYENLSSNLALLLTTLKPSANGRQKTLNKCETQNEIVFHIRLRHPETINSFC